jgi:hypothetical protein
MPWVICFLVGAVAGAIAVFVLLLDRIRKVKKRELATEQLTARAKQAQVDAVAKEKALERKEREAGEQLAAKARQIDAEAIAREQAITRRDQEGLERLEVRARNIESEMFAKEAVIERRAMDLRLRREEFEKQIITYANLSRENVALKRDLQNIDVTLHKLQLDGDARNKAQQHLDERSNELARRYLRETVKAVGGALNPNNFAACKDRLLNVIARVREIGFTISADEEMQYISELKINYERVVKAALEREEQARIRAQIREEERLRREVERELAQTEREEQAIQAALDQALAEARDQHSAEVDLLRAKLAEAQERAQRAISMAQQTKAGNVYVISNIGAFGRGVFKVGMTRRLEPLDRIRELGDASVPFPFDIHMMVSCDDAPSLENALHRALHKSRINRVNPRKEFFRAEFETILQVVRHHHGEVQYTADPEALEFNQSLTMSEADADYVEEVYEAAEEELPPVTET